MDASVLHIHSQIPPIWTIMLRSNLSLEHRHLLVIGNSWNETLQNSVYLWLFFGDIPDNDLPIRTASCLRERVFKMWLWGDLG